MKNTLALLFIFSTGMLVAQDTIVKIDSSRVVAKIIKVTDRKISYTRYNDPDSPTYETSRSHVARIAYANGTHETYGGTEQEQMASKDPNIISITTTDIVAGVITLNYERVIGGRVGIRAIGSMGILGTTGQVAPYYGSSYYYSRYKVFSAGVDVHYYVIRGARISYYTGALMEYGQVRQQIYWWEWPPYPPASNIAEYYFGGLTNGISLNAGHNINLDMFCSLGWRHNISGGYSDFAARFGFSLGYRF